MFKIFKNKRNDPILIYFFILNFLGFSQNIFKNRFYDNGWTVGEWLISYSGGFVRRGLIGSIIFQISEATKLNPILLVQIISAYPFLFSTTDLDLKNKARDYVAVPNEYLAEWNKVI